MTKITNILIKVLFVGSFKDHGKDGSVGGQMFACRSLLASSLKKSVEFILLDSTAESVPAPGFFARLMKAIFRLIIFCYRLITKRPRAVLIFSSSGFSFVEKGLMVLIAKPFSRTILAPRSGILLDNISSNRLFALYAKLVFKACHRIVAQGVFWKLFFVDLLKDHTTDKVIVIPNWIDTTRYFMRPLSPRVGKIRVIYIGWLETYKGIYDIIGASSMLKSRGIDFVLDIYGQGSQLQTIRAIIEAEGLNEYVKLKGWIRGEEKMEALRTADIYVLPSHREGFPNALLEAMAIGLPVIASNIGVIPEVIKPGFNGELFEKGSVLDLSEKIEKLTKDEFLCSMYGSNAVKTVLGNYSLQFAETKFREIIN